MRKILSISSIFIGLGLILAFQNCSPVSQDIKYTQNKLASEHSESGVPYDGKIFVLIGQPCSDGTLIQSKILLRSTTAADLVRKQCQDITPIALTAQDFQLSPTNSDQLTYLNQAFNSQVPAGGTAIDVKTAYLTSGFAYSFIHTFGTPPNTSAFPTRSKLLWFEDGVAMGPVHSDYVNISGIGLGRYSHWFDGAVEYLSFSASDNSNPAINGRVYSYIISP